MDFEKPLGRLAGARARGGEGRRGKVREASARCHTQYGVRPGEATSSRGVDVPWENVLGYFITGIYFRAGVYTMAAEAQLGNLRRTCLVDWRNGKTCCPVCRSREQTFARTGLQQHYRIKHKGQEVNDLVIGEGIRILREFAAAETLENILRLSRNRRELVSTMSSYFSVFSRKFLMQAVYFLRVATSIKYSTLME